MCPVLKAPDSLPGYGSDNDRIWNYIFFSYKWWFLIPAPGERERLVDPSEILSQKRQREIHVTLYYHN